MLQKEPELSVILPRGEYPASRVSPRCPSMRNQRTTTGFSIARKRGEIVPLQTPLHLHKLKTLEIVTGQKRSGTDMYVSKHPVT